MRRYSVIRTFMFVSQIGVSRMSPAELNSKRQPASMRQGKKASSTTAGPAARGPSLLCSRGAGVVVRPQRRFVLMAEVGEADTEGGEHRSESRNHHALDARGLRGLAHAKGAGAAEGGEGRVFVDRRVLLQ